MRGQPCFFWSLDRLTWKKKTTGISRPVSWPSCTDSPTLPNLFVPFLHPRRCIDWSAVTRVSFDRRIFPQGIVIVVSLFMVVTRTTSWSFSEVIVQRDSRKEVASLLASARNVPWLVATIIVTALVIVLLLLFSWPPAQSTWWRGEVTMHLDHDWVTSNLPLFIKKERNSRQCTSIGRTREENSNASKQRCSSRKNLKLNRNAWNITLWTGFANTFVFANRSLWYGTEMVRTK